MWLLNRPGALHDENRVADNKGMNMAKRNLVAWVYNKDHLGATEAVDVSSLEDSSAARVSGTVESVEEAVGLLQSVADVTRASNSDITAVRIDEGVVALLVVETADFLMVVR